LSVDRVELWRGLRDLEVSGKENFFAEGGTEAAPLSATSSLEVALRYSVSSSSVLMRLDTTSFIERGANLTYLSAFPHEGECVFPPLTFLYPKGKPVDVVVDLEEGKNVTFKIVMAAPRIGT